MPTLPAFAKHYLFASYDMPVTASQMRAWQPHAESDSEEEEGDIDYEPEEAPRRAFIDLTRDIIDLTVDEQPQQLPVSAPAGPTFAEVTMHGLFNIARQHTQTVPEALALVKGTQWFHALSSADQATLLAFIEQNLTLP
jgi:hypothetical protein